MDSIVYNLGNEIGRSVCHHKFKKRKYPSYPKGVDVPR